MEGGALARLPALNPTSSWWALVTLQPCKTCHALGLGGVNPVAAIRVINICWEASLREALKSIICKLTTPICPARAVRYVFSRLDTPHIPSHVGGWGMYLQKRVEAKMVRHALFLLGVAVFRRSDYPG
jgi:hypothetical protein